MLDGLFRYWFNSISVFNSGAGIEVFSVVTTIKQMIKNYDKKDLGILYTHLRAVEAASRLTLSRCVVPQPEPHHGVCGGAPV